jgi:hypothetical protein
VVRSGIGRAGSEPLLNPIVQIAAAIADGAARYLDEARTTPAQSPVLQGADAVPENSCGPVLIEEPIEMI